jgi:cysteinyl-tRNA synthetase
MQGLADCQKMVDRWRRFLAEAAASQDPAPARASEAARDEFALAMHDDLNVAKAVAAINSCVSAVDKPTPGDAAVLRLLDATLGVLERERPEARETEIGIFADGLAPDAAVEALLRQRRDARAAKDFAASDAIRDQLAALGYAVKDVAGGKVEVRRKQ